MATISQALEVAITVNDRGIQGAIANLGKQMTTTGAIMNAVWNQVATVAMNAIGQVAGKIKDLAKEQLSFETTMAAVHTMIPGNNAEKISELTEQIRRLSTETGKSVGEIGEAMYDAFSAGLPPTLDKTEQFMRTVVQASVAGRSTVKESTGAIISVLNTYNMSMDQAGRIANIYFEIIRKGITTMGELGNTASRLTPLASAAGVAIEDWAGAFATLTARKYSTDRAFTSLISVINGIIKPSQAARAAAKQFGVDFSATALKTKGLVGVLEELRSKIPMTAEVVSKFFSNKVAATAVLALAATNESFKQYDSNIVAMVNSTGSMEAAYAKMIDTQQASLNQLTQSFSNVFMVLWTELLPTLVDLLQTCWENTKVFVEWAKEISLVTRIIGIFQTVANVVTFSVKALTIGVMLLASVFEFAYDAISGILSGLALSVETTLFAIQTVFTRLVQGIMSGVMFLLKAISYIDPTDTTEGWAKGVEDAIVSMEDTLDASQASLKKRGQDTVKSLQDAWNANTIAPTAISMFDQLEEDVTDTAEGLNMAFTGKEFQTTLKKREQEHKKTLDKINAAEAVGQKTRADVYDQEAIKRREEDAAEQRLIQSRIDEINGWYSKSYKDQTTIYLNELKKREDSAKKSEEALKKISENRMKDQTSFEEKMWDISITNTSSDTGKRIQQRGIADTFITRANILKEQGKYEDAIELMKKAQSRMEIIATDTNASMPEKQFAVDYLYQVQSQINNAYDMMEKAESTNYNEQKARIDELSMKLLSLQEEAKIKLEFVIDSGVAESKVEQLRKSFRDVSLKMKEILPQTTLPMFEPSLGMQTPTSQLQQELSSPTQSLQNTTMHSKEVDQSKTVQIGQIQQNVSIVTQSQDPKAIIQQVRKELRPKIQVGVDEELLFPDTEPDEDE